MADASGSVEVAAAVIAAIGSITTAFGVMWKRMTTLADKQAEANIIIGRLEGRQEGIVSMSKSVLEEIHTIKAEKPGGPE